MGVAKELTRVPCRHPAPPRTAPGVHAFCLTARAARWSPPAGRDPRGPTCQRRAYLDLPPCDCSGRRWVEPRLIRSAVLRPVGRTGPALAERAFRTHRPRHALWQDGKDTGRVHPPIDPAACRALDRGPHVDVVFFCPTQVASSSRSRPAEGASGGGGASSWAEAAGRPCVTRRSREVQKASVRTEAPAWQIPTDGGRAHRRGLPRRLRVGPVRAPTARRQTRFDPRRRVTRWTGWQSRCFYPIR